MELWYLVAAGVLVKVFGESAWIAVKAISLAISKGVSGMRLPPPGATG